MTKEYIIYCDESESEGQYYSNFYGGAVVSATDLFPIVDVLTQKKQELNLYKEVKWSKLTDQYLDKYINLINSFRRSKRTIAKEKLYRYINKRICVIYPRFNIGCNTSFHEDSSNVWIHPYRHWLFKPKNHELDLTKSKRSEVKKKEK